METNYVIHVGAVLKDNLQTLGLSQKELCRRTGISTTIINEIIKGKRKISIDTAKKLEEVFGLNAKYWLDIQTEYELAEKDKNIFKINKIDDELLDVGYTADEIADRFICYENTLAKNNPLYERSLTPLKLQKLLYFIEKEFLKKDMILFKTPIIHWNLGPVVQTVYKRFKSSKEPISIEVNDIPLENDIEKMVKSFYFKNLKYTAAYLVEKSHKEQTWLQTNNQEAITPEFIKSFL